MIDPLSYNFTETSKIGKLYSSGKEVSLYSDTNFAELVSFYREQVKAMYDSVELYFIDISVNIIDMRAAVLACKKTDKPVFLNINVPSLECDVNVLKAAVVIATALKVEYIGITYAKEDTDNVIESIANELAMLVPNSIFVNVLLESHYKVDCTEQIDTAFVFASETDIYFLTPETTEISEPIICHSDMDDIITEVCSEAFDVLQIVINTPDDALDFSRNAHMATLPVMFTSEAEIALKLALMLYQGKALIDGNSLIDPERLEIISKRYGAVIY